MILLTESSVLKLDERVRASQLGHKFEIRQASTGPFETSDGRHLRYARLLFRNKKSGVVETIELLSSSKKNFDTLAGFVMYRNMAPEKTVYFRDPVSLDEFLRELGGSKSLNENKAASGMILAQTAMIGLQLLMALMSVFFIGKWVIDKTVSARDENKAKIDAEKRLNEFLFQGQTGNEAAFDSYKSIVSYVQNLVNGKTKGVTLYGMPGTGKTYIVRRTLHFAGLQPNKDYVIVKGSSANSQENIRIIYSTLYSYNGKIIVFDDFDSAMDDVNTTNLLKAALDSYPVRIISLPDMAQYNNNDAPLPSRFEFTGRIIMITNKNKIDPAILSRTQGVAINFTAREFQDNIRQMLQYVSPEVNMKVKEEVYQFLTDCVAENPDITLDFRRFSAMLDFRLAYPDDWKILCKDILYPR